MEKIRQTWRKKPSQVYDTTFKGFFQQQISDQLPVISLVIYLFRSQL